MRGQFERRRTPTQKPWREMKHPIIRFLEDKGFESKDSHGDRREMTKPEGFPRLVLHFYDKLFLSAHIHLADDRNIGKVNESQLKAFFAEGLCLKEHVESWAQVRFCKKAPQHDGACSDDYGVFPVGAA